MSNKLTLVKKMADILIKETKGFDRVLEKAKFFEAGNGCCKAELLVEQEIENKMGTLHGGFIATAVDTISTVALMLNDKNNSVPGVSVNINITYIKAAKHGEEVIIDAKTLKVGKTLAFLTVDVLSKKDGVLLAQGQHTKFVGR